MLDMQLNSLSRVAGTTLAEVTRGDGGDRGGGGDDSSDAGICP